MSSPEFAETYFDAARNLRSSPGQVAEVAHQYSDVHGDTRLVAHLRLEAERPAFDLSYAHVPAGDEMPTPVSLARHLPPNSRFRGSNIMNQTVLHHNPDMGVTVHVKLANLEQREGLWGLAHELGHGGQEPMVESLYRHASQGTLESATAVAEFGAYHPAMASIVSGAVGDRSLARLFDLVEGDNDRFDLFRAHDAVKVGLSAMLEVDAWVRASKIVVAGHVHPGLDAEQRKDRAAKALATYDEMYGSRLFSETLVHVLGTTAL